MHSNSSVLAESLLLLWYNSDRKSSENLPHLPPLLLLLAKWTWVVITWSRLAGMKFQPVQLRQISPYDYMWKFNFVLAMRGSFPPIIWLDLHAFFRIFLCKHVLFYKIEDLYISIDLNFFYLLFSLQLCLFFFIK